MVKWRAQRGWCGKNNTIFSNHVQFIHLNLAPLPLVDPTSVAGHSSKLFACPSSMPYQTRKHKKALPWLPWEKSTQENEKSKTKLLTMSYLSLSIYTDIQAIINSSILRLLQGWGIHVPLTIPTPIALTHSYKFQVGHASCSSSRHLSWAHLKTQDQPKGSWLQTGSNMIADSWNDSSENLSSDSGKGAQAPARWVPSRFQQQPPAKTNAGWSLSGHLVPRVFAHSLSRNMHLHGSVRHKMPEATSVAKRGETCRNAKEN